MQDQGKVHPSTARSRDTMRRYMDAAEGLYIRLGYEGTSIRAISTRAKTNLSAVVYHWGTKENLFRSVFLRRFAVVEQRKVELLKAIKARPEVARPPDLEAVVSAMVFPGFDLIEDPKVAFVTRQLYGRVLTDPSPVVLRISQEIFRDVTELWRELIRECLPEISDERFFWRFTSSVGALVFAQSFGYRMAYANRIEDDQVDWPAAPEEIVRFLVGGLQSGQFR
ncbi:TetR/AcrR family transcriptional regulator [Tsuneonella sp. HG222]